MLAGDEDDRSVLADGTRGNCERESRVSNAGRNRRHDQRARRSASRSRRASAAASSSSRFHVPPATGWIVAYDERQARWKTNADEDAERA